MDGSRAHGGDVLELEVQRNGGTAAAFVERNFNDAEYLISTALKSALFESNERAVP